MRIPIVRERARFIGYLLTVGVLLMLLFVPVFMMGYAYADEGSSSSSASLAAVEGKLEEISGKLDGLAEDVETIAAAGDNSALVEALENLRPSDNSRYYESVSKAETAIATIQVFELASILLLVGVALALVFLVSYRSHT